MKKLLIAVMALGIAAAMCACENVPEAKEYTNSATTESEQVTTEALTDEVTTTDENASESTEPTTEYAVTDEPHTLNEEAVLQINYGTWLQSNANAKANIADRVVEYITSKNSTVTVTAEDVISALNGIETAPEDSSVVTLACSFLNIEV